MNTLPIRYRELLGQVYPLADTLQMKLTFRANGENYSLIGSEKFELPVSGGFHIDLNCKVCASNVTETESWVLVHVKGNLWLFLLYLRKGRELQFMVLDGEKIGLKEAGVGWLSTLSVSALTFQLVKACKGLYYRSKDSAEWKRIDDVGVVDEGFSGKAEEGNRAANQEGWDTA